jgi:hypothetical protein
MRSSKGTHTSRTHMSHDMCAVLVLGTHTHTHTHCTLQCQGAAAGRVAGVWIMVATSEPFELGPQTKKQTLLCSSCWATALLACPCSPSLIPGSGVLAVPGLPTAAPLTTEECNLRKWSNSVFGKLWPLDRNIASDLKVAIHRDSPVLHAGAWRLLEDWEREPMEATPNMWAWWGPSQGPNKHMMLPAIPVRMGGCMLICNYNDQAGHPPQLLCAVSAALHVGI